MDKITLSTIEKYLKNPLTKLINGLSSEIKHVVKNKVLEYQVEEYNRNLYQKTLLHRIAPKNLLEIFQPLTISNNESTIQIKSIKDIFKNQFITLIGSAGSGKSTLIKFLFIDCIKNKYAIPIKIELRYLNDYGKSLTEYLHEKIFKLNSIATEDFLIERILEQENFVFFFDGYDEINSKSREKRTKEIDGFVKKYNKHKYILTSRPYTNIELLPLFHNYELQDLNDEEIIEFVKKQIPKKENELQEKIITAISLDRNENYKSFLRNPLLLSMFILTFQSYSDIPQKRSEFYRQVFDTLFSLHDSMSKLAYVREKVSGLSKDEFEDILGMFCFISYFEERFSFKKTYINVTLRKIKQKKKFIKFNNEKIIEDLKVAINILILDGTEYNFPHRSLQEYFASLYISKLNKENKLAIYTKIFNMYKDSLQKMSKGIKQDIQVFVDAMNSNERTASISSLLMEIDQFYFLENLKLPILRYFNEYVGVLINNNPNLKETYLFQFYPFVFSFIDAKRESNSINSIYKSYNEYTRKSFIKLEKEYSKLEHKNLEDIEKERNRITKAVDTKLLPKLNERFKKVLPKLKNRIEQQIKKLEDTIKRMDQSDSDIIDLI